MGKQQLHLVKKIIIIVTMNREYSPCHRNTFPIVCFLIQVFLMPLQRQAKKHTISNKHVNFSSLFARIKMGMQTEMKSKKKSEQKTALTHRIVSREVGDQNGALETRIDFHKHFYLH